MLWKVKKNINLKSLKLWFLIYKLFYNCFVSAFNSISVRKICLKKYKDSIYWEMNTMSIMDFEYAKITEKQSANISKKHSYPSNWREYMCLVSCSVISESLQLHGLQPARLLCPWGFSKQEYWSGLPWGYRGSSPPRDRTQVSHIAGRFFTD